MTQQNGQDAKVTISPVLISLVLGLFLLSWSLYVWLPFFLVIIFGVPIVFGMVVLLLVLFYGPLRHARLRVSRTTAYFLPLAAVVLIAGAPAYNYLYGVFAVRYFLRELGIQAQIQQQEWTMLEAVDDMAPPRHVRVELELLEPLATAKEKLAQRLNPENGWQLGSSGMSASCGVPLSYDDSNLVELEQNGHMLVLIFFGSQRECLLMGR